MYGVRVATLEGVDPSGVAVSPDGSVLFVVDMFNHKIMQVEAATGAVTTLAGSDTRGSADGVGGAAQFKFPCGVAISPDGSQRSVCGGLPQRQDPAGGGGDGCGDYARGQRCLRQR